MEYEIEEGHGKVCSDRSCTNIMLHWDHLVVHEREAMIKSALRDVRPPSSSVGGISMSCFASERGLHAYGRGAAPLGREEGGG